MCGIPRESRYSTESSAKPRSPESQCCATPSLLPLFQTSPLVFHIFATGGTHIIQFMLDRVRVGQRRGTRCCCRSKAWYMVLLPFNMVYEPSAPACDARRPATRPSIQAFGHCAAQTHNLQPPLLQSQGMSLKHCSQGMSLKQVR